MNNPIFVTQPSLPPLSEYTKALEKVWDSGIMTHCGPLMQELEEKITEYLKSPRAICVSSGTSALQLALKALDLSGEIITTPFTYIATANIIKWENCTPVFVDIEADSWNINPDLIEDAVTENTSAIMPVHVFSNPCDIKRIEGIAQKYNLKTIYDAAHAMCVNYNGKSIMSYGDISCTSFHATKLYNTCEGGACFTKTQSIENRLKQMRFFGFNKSKEIKSIGMNAKMTEIHAALGLVNISYIDEVLEDRKAKYLYYRSALDKLDFINFQRFNENEYNYSYMPISVNKALTSRLIEILEQNSIYPRKYFYPGLNRVPVFKQTFDLPVSDSLQGNILCLPLYYALKHAEIDKIIEIIKNI